MQICLNLISELKTLTLELNETELIDSLSSIINSQLKTVNIEYFFIFNKSICESGKTLEELNFIDNCKVFAVQKNTKPLKRELKDHYLKSILCEGPLAKKLCINGNEAHCEYGTWKNESLQDLQNKIIDLVNQDPTHLESIISQPVVQDLVKNPDVIPSLFSCNSVVNDLINSNPDQVKFFTDLSQYEWIKNIMAESNQYENIMNNYAENVKSVSESKRYKRMLSMYEKAFSEIKSDNEIDNDNKNINHVLKPLLKSKIKNNIIDLLKNDLKMATNILQSCPYGKDLSENNLAAMTQVMPEAMDKLKTALAQSNEVDDIVNFMRSNPIEVSEELASKFEIVTENAKEELPEQVITLKDNSSKDSRVSDVIRAVSDRIKSDSSAEGSPERSGEKFEKEIQLLNEMGFEDYDKNVEALIIEYGNIDRVVNKLLTTVN